MAVVRLKGLNSAKVKLASGETKTYWYAWRGGPALAGEPGTPEFMASYNAALAGRKPEPPKETISGLIRQYSASAEFTGRAHKTRKDYTAHLRRIEAKFGSFPVSILGDRRTRGLFLAWRDEIAASAGLRQADYVMTVFARVLSWAKNDRGLTDANPLEKSKRLYEADRTELVWTDEDEARFLSIAPPQLHLPLIMALWTGQRQGDLLRLTWAAYDGRVIRLRQSKTGERVVIPAGEPLKVRLDAMRRHAGAILLSSDGRPWTSDGFRTSWGRACKAAGIEGLTFHDLRGTAVTRLALAGSTESEIATITGLSGATVRHILDAHYLARDPRLAESAIRKLEQRKTGTIKTDIKMDKPATEGFG